MPIIKFILNDETIRTVEVKPGTSVMEAAVEHNIKGIIAECGGTCSCATCHVYLENDSQEYFNKASIIEEDMLDFAIEPQINSRLSCQLIVTKDVSQITVRVPRSQG